MVNINWAHIFMLDTPIIETFIRGTCVYLALFGMLRLILKREAGGLGITNLLVVVLLADAAQNAMADDYRSVPDGLLLVATIMFWSLALDWLGYRFPRLQRFVYPPPLLLVQDGRMLYRNMRRELITEDELLSQLRLQGDEDISRVKEAYMEGDGRISFILHNSSQQGATEHPVT